MSKLTTPSISVSSNILKISDVDTNATAFILKKDGVSYKKIFIINDTYVNVTADDHYGTIGENDTITINLTADGTNYKLPSTAPTVTGANSVYNKISNTSGTLILSNPTNKVSFTITGQSVYPIKGQLINMTLGNTTPAGGTNNQYRVLNINGTVAEVMAMYSVSKTCCYNSSGTNTYSGADLDTTLNTTFYNSLSEQAKSAIVDKNVVAYKYENDITAATSTHASYALYSSKQLHETIGTRHVYAMDVEDFETYFNHTFSSTDIYQMVWNSTKYPGSSASGYMLLRSAIIDFSSYIFFVTGYNGTIYNTQTSYSSLAAIPTFQIDLSKIDWSYVE